MDSEEAQYGVIPLENSLTGSIHENYDLLLEYDLKIVGELYLRLIHNLITKPGTKLEQIEQVWATDVAIQQCRQFLDQNTQWEIITVENTTSAVRMMTDADKTGDAAIGSADAAIFHKMDVIVEGIETNPRNFTRFVVIGKSSLPDRPKTKSSIVFATLNQPGALFEVMKVFADNNINMVKLESRPIHGKPWQYMFYADIEADLETSEFQNLLKELKEKTDTLKSLGSY